MHTMFEGAENQSIFSRWNPLSSRWSLVAAT